MDWKLYSNLSLVFRLCFIFLYLTLYWSLYPLSTFWMSSFISLSLAQSSSICPVALPIFFVKVDVHFWCLLVLLKLVFFSCWFYHIQFRRCDLLYSSSFLFFPFCCVSVPKHFIFLHVFAELNWNLSDTQYCLSKILSLFFFLWK